MTERGKIQKLIERFKEWLGLRLPDCSKVTPKIGESLDRRLGPWDRLVMKLHLFTCDRCGRYLRQLRFMSETFHEHSELIADPPNAKLEFSSDAKSRMKKRLNNALYSAV